MTDTKLRADTDMGRYAAQVLENPAFAEAFERVQKSIVAAWSKCPTHEVEAQQFLLLQMKLVPLIKSAIVGMIEQGKLADSQMPIAHAPEMARQSPVVRDFHRRVASRR